MKKYLLTKINLIILINIISSCSSINYYYKDLSQASNEDLKIQQQYYENSPKKFYRDKGEVLLVFNKEAFQNSKIIINNKDTLFFEKANPPKCLGSQLYIINKKEKYITLKSDYKKTAKFKIYDNYDYIKINGGEDNKWAIEYSQFLPVIKCK